MSLSKAYLVKCGTISKDMVPI